jgi:hypothetical protein
MLHTRLFCPAWHDYPANVLWKVTMIKFSLFLLQPFGNHIKCCMCNVWDILWYICADICICIYTEGWGDSLFQDVGTWPHGFKVQSITVFTKSCIANLTVVDMIALSAVHRTYIKMITLLTRNFIMQTVCMWHKIHNCTGVQVLLVVLNV